MNVTGERFDPSRVPVLRGPRKRDPMTWENSPGVFVGAS
jgi:hypothetical protein